MRPLQDRNPDLTAVGKDTLAGCHGNASGSVNAAFVKRWTEGTEWERWVKDGGKKRRSTEKRWGIQEGNPVGMFTGTAASIYKHVECCTNTHGRGRHSFVAESPPLRWALFALVTVGTFPIDL